MTSKYKRRAPYSETLGGAAHISLKKQKSTTYYHQQLRQLPATKTHLKLPGSGRTKTVKKLSKEAQPLQRSSSSLYQDTSSSSPSSSSINMSTMEHGLRIVELMETDTKSDLIKKLSKEAQSLQRSSSSLYQDTSSSSPPSSSIYISTMEHGLRISVLRRTETRSELIRNQSRRTNPLPVEILLPIALKLLLVLLVFQVQIMLTMENELRKVELMDIATRRDPVIAPIAAQW